MRKEIKEKMHLNKKNKITHPAIAPPYLLDKKISSCILK